MTRLLILLATLTTTSAVSGAPLPEKAHKLTEKASHQLAHFDASPRWESVKNTVGSAKAVLLLPKGGQFGYLVGTQWGQGLLFARHNQSWSQPLFVKVNSAMFGLLIGGQKTSAIGIMLSKDFAEQTHRAQVQLGGTADLTVFKGISGKVVAGTGGITTLMVSENSGLFFGGSMDAFAVREDKPLNASVYGERFNSAEVINDFRPSQSPLIRDIQKDLNRIATEAVFDQQTGVQPSDKITL